MYCTSFLFFMSYQRKVCGIFVFCYFFLFCSLVGNENIKRLGFYTLQVTTVFSNFPALKQLSKIKNTRECCDPLEFVISLSWRSEIYIYISVIRDLVVAMFLSVSFDLFFEYYKSYSSFVMNLHDGCFSKICGVHDVCFSKWVFLHTAYKVREMKKYI